MVTVIMVPMIVIVIVIVIVVMVMVAMIATVVMVVPVVVRHQTEALRPQAPAQRNGKFRPGFTRRLHGGELGHHWRGKRGQRVDQRRDEHVAGDTAHQVEVNRERRRGRQNCPVRRRRGRHMVLPG
jgi:ABC-type transport system involved in cytochrome bd biosynthesis fused ATPase/permease subunit